MTNILIVEDEQNLARFIELELTHENYNVDIENDGRTGLDKALNKSYDLIILDLMLPNINGLEICRQIRQEYSTPIIIITAKGESMIKLLDSIMAPMITSLNLSILRNCSLRLELSYVDSLKKMSLTLTELSLIKMLSKLQLTVHSSN